MPWFGLVITDILSVWLSRMGLGTDLIVYILPIAGIGLLALCKARNISIRITLARFNIVLSVAFIIGLFFSLYPLVVDQLATTITMGNNDAALYAIVGDYLKTHGYQQVPRIEIDHPSTHLAKVMLTPGHRPGSSLLYATVSSLFRLPTYQILTITLGIFFSLTPILIGIFTWTLTSNKFSTLIALSTSLFNTNFLWANYHGFAAQVPAQGILILLFLLFYLSEIETKNIFYLLSIAFSLSALFTLYTEITAFFIIPYTFYFAFRCFQRKDKILSYLETIFYTFIATFSIDPFGLLEGISFLNVASKSEAGWVLPRWALPVDIVGLLSIHSDHLSIWISLIASISTTCFIILGIIKSNNKVLGVSICLFSILILSYLRFYRHFSYGYYKAVVFLCFSYIIYFSIGLSYFINKIINRKYSSQIKVTVLLMITAISFSSVRPMFLHMKALDMSVNRDLLELSEASISFSRKYNMVASFDISCWENIWASYLFKNIPLSYDRHALKTCGAYLPNSFIKSDSNLHSNLYLINKKSLPSSIILRAKEAIYWSNDSYAVVTGDKVPYLGENWWPSEKWWGDTSDSQYFRWMNQNGILLIDNNQDKLISKFLNIKFVPILPKTTIDVYINNELTQTISLTKDFKFYAIPLSLKSGTNQVRFHVREPIIKESVINGNALSDRQLAVGVNAIILSNDAY